MTKILNTIANHFPEFMISLMTVAWGAMLLTPTSTFDTSEGYTLIATVGTELMWGLVFFVSGLVNMVGVALQNKRLVRGSSRFLMFLWTAVAIAFVIAAPSSASWPLIAGLAALFGWSAAEYTVNR